MTQVRNALILELQQIIKEEYGKDLTLSEVSEIANTVVNYFNLLAEINFRMENAERNGLEE